MTGILRVEVLGPFRLLVDGTPVEVSRPQVRSVLAILAASDEAVSSGKLIECLWGEEQPSNPNAAIRTVVSRARAALGRYADSLMGTGEGYRLDVDSDVRELEEIQKQAANADHLVQVDLLEQGRKLLRGVPFTAVIDSVDISIERARCDRLANAALRQLVFCYADVGRDRDAAELALELLEDAPEDEGLARDAALCLARLGRKTDSLELLQKIRSRLVERGLDPSATLLSVEREILQGETDLLDRPKHPARVSEAHAFVGRVDQLHFLIQGRISNIVFVEGESGIGKTSLLTEYEQHLAEQDTAVIRSIATLQASAPMEMLRDLVAQLLDADQTLAVEEQHRSSLAMLLPERMGGVSWPSSREALISGAVDFIAGRCELSGTHIVIDDAQWLDMASIAGLAGLIENGRCQIVIASRPGHRKHILGDSIDQAEVIELGPLSGGECDVLIREALPNASDDVVTHYEQRSGGNPFFLQMLLDLERQEIGSAELPPAVLVAVQKRVDSLSKRARRALQLASIVGWQFKKSTLEELVPESSLGLSEAVHAGLVHEAEGGVLTFQHAIVADAVRQLLGDGERIALHDQIGRILEAEGEPPMVVWPHCQQAAEIDGWRAIDLSAQAANQQLQTYGWEGAIEAANWGLEFHRRFSGVGLGPSHRLLIAKAQAELATGVANSHIDLMEGARQAGEANDDGALIGAVIELCNSGSVALTGIDLEAVKTLVDAALARSETDPRNRELQAASARAFVYSRHGEFGQQLYAEAFNDFENLDHRVQELVLRNSEAGLSNPEDFRLARRATMLLAEAADRNPELRWLARWFQYRDSLISGDGDRLAWALHDLRSSATSSERRHAFVVLGQTFDMEMQRSWAEATMALIHEDYSLAEECANQALATGLEQLAIRDDGFGEGWVTASYGLLLLAIRHGQGRLCELVDVVETTAPSIPAWRVAIVITNHAAGNTDRVRSELDVLTANRFEALVRDPTWTAAMFLLAEPVAEFCDRDTVQCLYERIEPYTDRMSYSGLCTFGSMHEAFAILADALGKHDQAVEHRALAAQMVHQLREGSSWALLRSVGK